jgi:hypothetical protein
MSWGVNVNFGVMILVTKSYKGWPDGQHACTHARARTHTHHCSNVINGYSSLMQNKVHSKYVWCRQAAKNIIITLLSAKFPKQHCPVVGLAI